jgi:nicotinamide mononucleotide transporter
MPTWISRTRPALPTVGIDWQALLAELPPTEAVAVLLAIAYLVLAVRENVWCWPAGIASSLIYVALMFGASLYMESGLQVFYAGLGVYGWREWQRAGPRGTPLAIRTWPPSRHGLAVGGILALGTLSGLLLARYTPAAFPFLDSFTTWGAIVATWMVARKILENWLYWFVIDSVSGYLYASRGLYLTAGLFGLYLVLIVVGWQRWRRCMAAAAP